jgi:hypothetical protein
MPYTNEEQIIGDMTLDYDIATNTILALDRGEKAEVNPSDDHTYMIKRLVNRMRQSDFKALPPQIQQAYEMQKQQHVAVQAQNAQALKQMESQFIPSGGYLVASDLYVSDPKNPGKLPKRIRLPSEALQWLVKQLESQGTSQEQMSNMDQGTQAEVANQFIQRMALPQGPGAGPQQLPGQGQAPGGHYGN